MFRSLPVLLLLLNYLLVVCIGVVGREPRPATRAFAYVHSAGCQQHNAWRGGTCFDDCNGIQYQMRKGHKPLPLQQLLTMQKAVDAHCLPTVAAMQAAYCPQVTAVVAEKPQTGVPVGVRGVPDAPPRRG